MQICRLQTQDRARWDAYLASAPGASVFHLSGWSYVMQQTFGLQTHFLYAWEDGRVLGVAPLLQVRSPLSGHFLTSMPGGVCADGPEVARALIERAKELVRAQGASHLILRDSLQKWDHPELVTDESQCTLIIELPESPEDHWPKINRRTRQYTKQAINSELRVVQGWDYLNSYYPIYAQAMRALGTPTFGLRFFRNIFAEFPSLFSVVYVTHEDQIFGGGFIAGFEGTLYNTWGGMLREFYGLGTNYLLHWEIIRYGCVNGFRRLDMGRSGWQSGTFQFKRKWGSKPQPLYQQIYLNGSSKPPTVGDKWTESAKYRYFVKVWQRLPLRVTEVLGPWVRKQMPFG